MINKFVFFLILAAFCLSSVSALYGEDSKKALSSSQSSIKTINNIVIDTKKKEITLKCKLAITEGILEFFLVDDIGQTYESVFKIVGNKPSDLHFALLLLGFEPVPFNEFTKLLDDKDGLAALRKKNCLLDIRIMKGAKEIPLSSVIRLREEDKNTKPIWVFTGASFTAGNKYSADLESKYVCIWPELPTVINLFSSAGNPYRGELGYEISKDIPFSMEDDIEIVIKAAQ
jgi:hypothetical protein